MDREEVPNKYFEEEVFEPQVEIQHSQETAKEVIYLERIPDTVREDMTGGCQHKEVNSLVKEYKQTLEVNQEKMEYPGKVRDNYQETSSGNVEGKARLDTSTDSS